MVVVRLAVPASAPSEGHDGHRGDPADDHRYRYAERVSEECSQIGE